MSASIKWWTLKTDADCLQMVGKIIYEPYAPAKCGRITHCWIHEPNGSAMPIATILWLKTRQSSNRGLIGMRDLELLVEDHKRKIKTHEKRIKEVKKL